MYNWKNNFHITISILDPLMGGCRTPFHLTDKFFFVFEYEDYVGWS